MAEFNINNLSDIAKGALFNQLDSIARGGEVIKTSEIEDDAVTSDKLDSGTIKTIEVNLSAAEIIALSATPIELVAAVADKTIVIDGQGCKSKPKRCKKHTGGQS